ncbi:MAG: hypothetical protein AB7F64_04710 [Gammaproteobacteria bacterium]
MLPRLIRLRDVSHYLGMDINRFNKEVRPKLLAIPIGKQGIAFDRLDLDAWVAHYKSCLGRPIKKGISIWDEKEFQDSKKEEKFGTSTSSYLESEFAKALAQARSKKLKNI